MSGLEVGYARVSTDAQDLTANATRWTPSRSRATVGVAVGRNRVPQRPACRLELREFIVGRVRGPAPEVALTRVLLLGRTLTVRDRLRRREGRLGDADWLDGAFSAGDLMMVSVLLRLKASGLLNEHPNLAAYVARGEARPAYVRAFAALAFNTGERPAG